MSDFPVPEGSVPSTPVEGGNGSAPFEGSTFAEPLISPETVTPVPSVIDPALARIGMVAQVGNEYVAAEGARATAEVTYEAARVKVESNQSASETVKKRAFDVLERIQKKLENTANSATKSRDAAAERHAELQAVLNQRARLNAMAPAEALKQKAIQEAVTGGFGVNPELAGRVEVSPAKVKVKRNPLEWVDTQFKKLENRWRIKQETVNGAVASAARTASDGLRGLISTVRGNETARFDQVAASGTGAYEAQNLAQDKSANLRSNLTSI